MMSLVCSWRTGISQMKMEPVLLPKMQKMPSGSAEDWLFHSIMSALWRSTGMMYSGNGIRSLGLLILSHDWVTVGGVYIDNGIYWMLKDCNCSTVTDSDTPQFATAHTGLLSLLVNVFWLLGSHPHRLVAPNSFLAGIYPTTRLGVAM